MGESCARTRPAFFAPVYKAYLAEFGKQVQKNEGTRDIFLASLPTVKNYTCMKFVCLFAVGFVCLFVCLICLILIPPHRSRPLILILKKRHERRDIAIKYLKYLVKKKISVYFTDRCHRHLHSIVQDEIKIA